MLERPTGPEPLLAETVARLNVNSAAFDSLAAVRPMLSEVAWRELEQLSPDERYRIASALGEPMLAQLAKLAHHLRVSTMGEMVSALAHELNQPLYAISNYARTCEILLRNHAELHGDVQNLADKLVRQASRAADIVRRMRRFASRGEPRRVRLDVNHLVREVEQMMLFQANRLSILVLLDLAPDLPKVQGDSLLIEQVLVNLLRNSFEAMDEAHSLEPRVRVRTAPLDDQFVEITITDNGPGFGDVSLEQLFEAYYTTKQSGMGLGLVISKSIVHAHGGTLTASHRPLDGAQFHLTLPVFSEVA